MKAINCSRLRLRPIKMNKIPSSLLNPMNTYPVITLGIVVCGMLTLIAAFLCMFRKSQSFGDEHTLEEFRQALHAKMGQSCALRDAEISGDGTLCDDTTSAFGSDDCYTSLEINNEIKKFLAQDGAGDASCVEVEEERTMKMEETQVVEVEEMQAMEPVEAEEMQTAEVEETQFDEKTKIVEEK